MNTSRIAAFAHTFAVERFECEVPVNCYAKKNQWNNVDLHQSVELHFEKRLQNLL